MMTTFTLSIGNMVNYLIIALGLGICGMILLQVSSGTRLDKDVKHYFQLFFGMIMLYIGCSLLRQLMEGFPGNHIRIGLHIVVFVEFVASGVMAWLFSLLTLNIAAPDRGRALYDRLFLAVLIFHAVLMLVTQFVPICYYFDAENVYHRAPGYLLSNLAHIVMLVMDISLLIRWKAKFRPQVRIAFWNYIIAPIVAIVIQGVSRDFQLIIPATIGAAVYMSGVIMQDLVQKYEQQQAVATRIGAELSMATDIQASQLPRLFPPFPSRPEFDLYASMTPAKEVGGDFYDFFLVDDNHIALVMADVSGKGVPAALFMMIARVLIKAHLQNGETPGEALENVNDQLCESNEAQLFVTVWLAVLDIATGRGIAANAGHEHPVLRRAGGQYELVVYRHSPAVAAMEGIPYKEHTFEMYPGDSLFVYTDGVAEATNGQNELFGTDRMLAVLNRDPDAAPEAVLENVMNGINAFVAGADQFDDITMLCLKYNGAAHE